MGIKVLAKIASYALVFLGILDGVDVDPQRNYVTLLTRDNFQHFLQQYDHVFVMFHAKWCRWCKSAGPEFSKAAEKLAELRSNVKFGQVDVDADVELAEENDVSYMPMMRFYSGEDRVPIRFFGSSYWDAVKYTGDPKADDMVSWLLERTTAIETAVEVDASL